MSVLLGQMMLLLPPTTSCPHVSHDTLTLKGTVCEDSTALLALRQALCWTLALLLTRGGDGEEEETEEEEEECWGEGGGGRLGEEDGLQTCQHVNTGNITKFICWTWLL